MGSCLCIEEQDKGSKESFRTSFKGPQKILQKMDPKNTLHLKTSKGFNNLSGKECFVNALLQCLYNLDQFKSTLRLKTGHHSEGVLMKLNDLFLAMDQNNSKQELIEKKKMSFLQEIQQNYRDIEIFKEGGGDSRMLFEAIKSLACKGKEPIEHEIFRLFSTGKMTKKVKCQACPESVSKELHEDIFMLHIYESLYYKENSHRNFFQPETQQIYCKICKQQQEHSVEAELEDPPAILALRIGESPVSSQDKRSKLPLTIEFNRGKKRYNLVAGVYNTSQGQNGEHSVAYVKMKGETEGENLFLCYSDLNIRLIDEGKMKGFAKMMFYCEER